MNSTANAAPLKQYKPTRAAGAAGPGDVLIQACDVADLTVRTVVNLGLKSRWLKSKNPRLTQWVERGLPITSVKALSKQYDMGEREFAKQFLLIPSATMTRRKQTKHLSADESDRAVRFARLLALTTHLMHGDEDAARRWLRSPRDLFNGESPQDHARTEVGAREVEGLIDRIREGVFS